jgi:hypothetical protein
VSPTYLLSVVLVLILLLSAWHRRPEAYDPLMTAP